MTMNQFQLILLMLLTNAYIPFSIVDYLTGLKVTTCSFNFIPFAKIPGLKGLVEWMDFDYELKALDSFGIFSGSSFVNNFSLICIYLVILMIHGVFTLIYMRFKPKNPEKEKAIKRWNKVYQVFNLSIYVRLFLQANQFLLLSSFAELYKLRMDNTRDMVSLGISLVSALICVGLIYICLYEWWILKNRPFEEDQHLHFKELMSGVKESRKGRIYSTLLLGRRFIFVGFLICAQEAPAISIISTLFTIQVIYFCTLVYLRPFKEANNNLIEITNEIFFTLIVGLLLHYNTESNWTDRMESGYLMLIIVNSAVIICIMAGGFAVKGVKK